MKKYLVLFLVLILALYSPLYVLADETNFTIKAEEVTAKKGETVSVKFSFSNNPGISLMVLGIGYDKTNLKLKEINGNSLMGGLFTPTIGAEEDYILWMSSTYDSPFNGTVFTAVFEVLKTAKSGKTEVSVLLPMEDSNILNFNGDEVNASIVSGYVDIEDSPVLSGDINADNIVDLQDVTSLSRYLAGWDIGVNNFALDVDGDLKINLNDLVHLAQFVAGWQNVKLNS